MNFMGTVGGLVHLNLELFDCDGWKLGRLFEF